MNRKIAVLSQKGGVGKTTVTLNLAFALCRVGGRKVLVIDADLQGGVASAVYLKPEKGLVQILRGECSLKEALIPLKGDNLVLLATGIQGPEDSVYLEEQAMTGKLRAILAVFGEYDFVLYDSPAGIGVINREILSVCNSFIQVIDCRASSVKSMARLLKLSFWIRKQVNPELYLEGVVVNRFQPESVIQVKILERVKSRFPARFFFETLIEDDPVFEHASIKGVPVARCIEGKAATKAFLALAIEVCAKKMSSQEDINALVEKTLGDEFGDLDQLFGKEGDEAFLKTPVNGDRVVEILRELCANGGCRGAVVADEMGLSLAEYQSPFGVDALATYGSILGEALIGADNILQMAEANNIVMDINDDEKLVMRRFPHLDSNYFLLAVCPHEVEALGELEYAADRIVAEL